VSHRDFITVAAVTAAQRVGFTHQSIERGVDETWPN
jgi:hypothetical protein